MGRNRFLATDVTAGYESFSIDEITFELESGDMMALVGKSGSGKSTLIKTFLGLRRALSGNIWFEKEGERVDIEKVIGYSPQENALYPFLTLRENLMTFGRMRGMSKDEIRNRQTKILKDLDIEDSLDRRIDQLSGGMRKRADIATAILHEPELVVLDEPFSGIDPPQREIIWQRIEKLSDRGRIVIITSHNIESLLEKCNRYGLIHERDYYNTQRIRSLMEDTDYHSVIEFISDSFRM